MQLFAIQKSKNVAYSSLCNGWSKKPIYFKFWFVSKSYQQCKGALFREKGDAAKYSPSKSIPLASHCRCLLEIDWAIMWVVGWQFVGIYAGQTHVLKYLPGRKGSQSCKTRGDTISEEWKCLRVFTILLNTILYTWNIYLTKFGQHNLCQTWGVFSQSYTILAQYNHASKAKSDVLFGSLEINWVNT